jgi:hypothetical protein
MNPYMIHRDRKRDRDRFTSPSCGSTVFLNARLTAPPAAALVVGGGSGEGGEGKKLQFSVRPHQTTWPALVDTHALQAM